MTDEEKLEFEKDVLTDVETHLIRRRFNFVQDTLRNQREDIETLFRYNKYVTIYALILNIIMVGIIVCLILTN